MTVVKVIETVGESQRSWTDAVQNAVRKPPKPSGDNGVEVYNLTANVENGQIVEYKANISLPSR